jgi:hypothetical protein
MALSRTTPVLAVASLFAALPLLAASLGTAAFLAAPGARAAGSYDSDSSRPERRGPYIAVGGGGILQLAPSSSGSDANTFGYDVEGRVGASFNSRFQLYLSANYDSASHSRLLGSVRLYNSNFMVNLNHAFYVDNDFGVYARIGIGLGVTGSSSSSVTQKGLGEVYALGFDIHLSDETSLTPEVFYRRTNESTDARVDSVGLQLNLVYY